MLCAPTATHKGQNGKWEHKEGTDGDLLPLQRWRKDLGLLGWSLGSLDPPRCQLRMAGPSPGFLHDVLRYSINLWLVLLDTSGLDGPLLLFSKIYLLHPHVVPDSVICALASAPWSPASCKESYRSASKLWAQLPSISSMVHAGTSES